MKHLKRISVEKAEEEDKGILLPAPTTSIFCLLFPQKSKCLNGPAL